MKINSTNPVFVKYVGNNIESLYGKNFQVIRFNINNDKNEAPVVYVLLKDIADFPADTLLHTVYTDGLLSISNEFGKYQAGVDYFFNEVAWDIINAEVGPIEEEPITEVLGVTSYDDNPTEEPTTEEPIETDQLDNEGEPIGEEPTTEEPTTEEPIVEEPIVEEPTSEPINIIKVLPNLFKFYTILSDEWFDEGEFYMDKISNLLERENLLSELEFSEDDLNNFYSTLCQLILDYTEISGVTRASDNNPIYDAVLNYFAGMQSDATSLGLGLILNTGYATSTTSSGCGCNTVFSENTNQIPCTTLYANAMKTYLASMLGDTQFYRDWFFTELGTPNISLTKVIVRFIEEFKELGYSLVFSKTTTNCQCPTLSSSDAENECNYGILDNYIKVMEYVEADQIKENTNKIKIYGNAFGELLPKMQF